MRIVHAPIRWRGSRTELKSLLRSLPSICAGKTRDHYGIGRAFRVQFGVTMLEQISKAFLVKSIGGTDELGDKWKPLAPATIAQRPVTAGEKKRLGITGPRERGLLTPDQNKLWKAIFASKLAKLATMLPYGEAKALAAKSAWGILKSKGALTKLAVLGNRQVTMLIVTGKLFKSLYPGYFLFGQSQNYVPGTDQVFRVDRPGIIELGSKVKYANHQHAMRPLWPDVRKQGPWLSKAASDGMDLVATILGNKVR